MSGNIEPGDEPGREPGDDETKQYAGQTPDKKHPVPLFLRDGNDGTKGNAQDEKDEIGE
jgi:hypothetical protein